MFLISLKNKHFTHRIRAKILTRHHTVGLELTLALPGVAQESQKAVFMSAVG